MKTIEQLLKHLGRADVTEFAVVSGKLPCVKVSGQYEPVDDSPPNTERVLQMLVSCGGSRYVDALGTDVTNWSFRLDGVGAIAVAAVMRDERVQARFAVTKRDGSNPRGPVATPPPVRGKDDGLVRRSQQPTMREESQSLMSEARAAVAEIAARQLEELDDFGALESKTKPDSDGLNFELDPEANAGNGTFDSSRSEVGEPRKPTVRELRLAPMPSRTKPPYSDVVILPELERLLLMARNAQASDVHIIADRPVLLRIGGELVARGTAISPLSAEAMIEPAIVPHCREVFKTEGSCDFALMHPRLGRFRVNVSRQRTGIKASMRVIPLETPTLQSLGLPLDIERATHHHQGLIVLTGPTGHGKTSTLAAVIDLLNRETTHHIITVEDPIEYVHSRKKALLSQREVGTHTKSFQNALKGSLREDPDVIVVGELRDTETVRMALSASETGHLVIGTMNTPTAAKAIDRLIDLFPPGDQQQVRMTLAGGLRLVVGQRLVPTPDRQGMSAAAELLPGSIALWNLIRDNKTFQIPSLQQRGKSLGIVRLEDSLVDLVKAGKTTKEAAIAVAEQPGEVEAMLRDDGPAQAPPPPIRRP